jgi:ankyrin repeat protein
MLAALADSPECIHLLLNYGARINYVRATGQTALAFTVLHDHLECAKLLLEQKADPNLSMIHPAWTRLHQAVFYNHIEIAKLLIKYRIALEPVNGNGESALEMAVLYYKNDMINVLLDAGAKVKPSFSHFALIKCRRNVKHAIITIKGILKMRWYLYRDVVTLVGEFIWKTRGSEEWHI